MRPGAEAGRVRITRGHASSRRPMILVPSGVRIETVNIKALLTSAGEAAAGGWPAGWGDGNQLCDPQAGHAIHVCMVSIFYSRGDQGSESQATHFHSHPGSRVPNPDCEYPGSFINSQYQLRRHRLGPFGRRGDSWVNC